jgi:hypothetical protein
MTSKQASCEERINEHMESRLEDIRKLWEAYQAGEEEVEDLGSIFDYGLSIDYVAPGTFGEEQEEGYLRYQLSYGGPSDEFRFYLTPNGRGWQAYKIEYAFLDWFDGATRRLYGEDRALMDELFDWFEEGGTVAAEIAKAGEA